MDARHDETEALRAELRQQREAMAHQTAILASMQARLDQLEQASGASAATPVFPVVDPATTPTAVADLDVDVDDGNVDGVDGDGRTDRRDLLRQAGVAVAGVAAGAVVLGQAAPAAAAQGTFDGDPAVLGTANPNSGLGVRGETLTGTGVQGRSQAAVGPAIGVDGFVAGTLSTGVRGIATNSTSATTGVLGQVASADGTGVRGVNTVTTGSAVGTRGESSSPGGSGVLGSNFSLTGTALAVAGMTSSPTGTAILGNALAVSGSAIGVWGSSSAPSGVGVQGTAPGSGVSATSTDGVGVVSSSNRTQLRLDGTPAAPLGAGLARSAGEIVLDTGKNLWLCVVSGTPGIWRRLGGASTAGALTLLSTPVRVYDSRPGNNPTTPPKTPITGGTTRVIDTKGSGSGVPAGASGVLVTLTVVNVSANGGFLALFKAGAATPSTSSINWSGAGQVVATTTVSAVDATGQVAVYCPPSSSTDLILDVIGYYQ